VYDVLLRQLVRMNSFAQRKYIRKVIDTFSHMDADFMAEQYQLDIEGVVNFLKPLVERTPTY